MAEKCCMSLKAICGYWKRKEVSIFCKYY